MTRFRTYGSRAEQLSLAAMAEAPTPGVQGSAEQAAVPSAVSRDAEKLALLEELKESIQRMERESAPTFVGPSQRNPDPGYPAQLSERQQVTTPPDALCLSHACIAAGDARRWLAEHGEQGFRYPGDRTQEILEEQLAKAFRQHVVDLMLEYAQFDEERRFYCDRAVAIANGSLPEDKDIPFYAACLNGCIEVIPLGYADYQGTSVIGAGPLRISVGNGQASGPDGTSTGHFVLLQSWLPLQTDLRQCGAFPFGVCAAARCVAESANVAAAGSAGEPATAATRVPGQLGDVEQEARPSPPPTSDQPEDSAGQASLATALERWQSDDVELLASPSSPRTGEQLQNSAGQPVLPFASVARHNDDVEQEASRSPPRLGDQLEDLARKLRGRESESRARILLQDMSVLRAWQQSTGKRGASHAERDAMLKVGTRWSVQGKLGGKKRPAADVAQELENCMIRTAESMFAMSGRRAGEPQTEAMGPCVSDASDAKRRDILVNTTTTKPECSTPELDFQPQRAAGSAAQPLGKRTAGDGKRLRSIGAAQSIIETRRSGTLETFFFSE